MVVSKLWWGDVKFTGEVIKQKNAANSTLEANVNALPDLKTGYNDILQNGPAPKDILAALPTTVNLPAFSASLEAAGALVGVQLESVSLDVSEAAQVAPAVASGPLPVSFHATAKGSYAALKKFVANIEGAQRPISIQTVTFSGQHPDVTADLILTSYYQPVSTVDYQTESFTQ